MINAFDFFCGAGGLTRGLLDAGIKVICGIDSDVECRETYERNNSPTKFIHRNICELPDDEIEGILKGIPRKDLLFAACAPCQPFSKQRTNPKDKSQRTLLAEFARLVDAYQPEYVLVENVPGISKISGRSTYRRFIATLDKNHYYHDSANIDAKDYGVPQTRTRHIVLARKSCAISIPAPTHGHGHEQYRKVREVISHFPEITAGETHSSVPNHRASALSEENLRRIRLTPPNGGDRRDWPEDLMLECHKGNYQGHTDVYGRMWWDRPAPALTCKCHSLSNGRYGHPEQNRAISLREAAALQTFPDNYVFHGKSKQSIGNQIGNSVPVAFATILGTALIREGY